MLHMLVSISVMEEQEQTNKKIQTGANLDPAVHAAVEKLRVQENRTMSNMIEQLLKTHERVQPILEGQTAEASA